MENLNKINDLTGKARWTFQWLQRKTTQQRENYFESVMNFEKDLRTKKVAKFFEATGKLPTEDFKSETREEENLYYVAKRADSELNKIITIQLQSLKEAEDYFNGKLLTIISKLQGFGMLEPNINLTSDNLEISDQGVDFWIEATKIIILDVNGSRYSSSNSKIEKVGRVHARMVWVNCYDKASHWRFITTLKKQTTKPLSDINCER